MGKRIEISGRSTSCHFEESGKMVEEWASYDLLGAMRQMGTMPE